MAKLNGAYQAKIIMKMFDDDEEKMAQFHEDYCNARHYARAYSRPTQQDQDIYMKFKAGALYSELMKEYQTTYAKIQAAASRVVRSQP